MSDDGNETGALREFYQSLGPFTRYLLAILTAVYLSAFAIGFAYLLSNAISNQPREAAPWAAIVTGLATVLLVAITALYAWFTRQLVDEMETSRREERKREREKEIQNLDKLRHALLQEIRAVGNLHELSRSYSPGYSGLTELVPMTVYEANAQQLGLLTDEEIEAIVDYYTQAGFVNDHLAVQRDMDTPIGWGIFEQVYRRLSFNWLFFRKERRERTELTAKRIGELAELQNEAELQLRLNLESQEE